MTGGLPRGALPIADNNVDIEVPITGASIGFAVEVARVIVKKIFLET